MDKIKRAHLARAREMYNDPNTETPGSFEEFFQGQYADQYGKENPKLDPNSKVIKRYLSYLSHTREGDRQEQPGLLSYVQKGSKGPYPANAKEDGHLLLQIMKYMHSEEIQDSIRKYMQSSIGNLAEAIANTSATFTGKFVYEIRQQREVVDETETAILTIATEEQWTMAKRMGMKRIDPAIVQNSIQVAGNMYNKMEEKMKLGQQAPMQRVDQMGGMQEQKQPPEEMAQPV